MDTKDQTICDPEGLAFVSFVAFVFDQRHR